MTEARKLLGLRPAVGAVAAALLLTLLLAWVNARSVRAAIEGVRNDVDPDPAGLGVSEALLSVAASAALGVLVFWQEYRPMPEDLGGGRQAATSELAVPRRVRRCLAKYVLAALAGGVVTSLAIAESTVVVRRVLGPHAPPMTAVQWQLCGRVVLYATFLSLFGAGVTLVLRNGLIPMVYLVASSTVVSVGFLLALRWSWAWYLLPDALGPAVVHATEQPGMPPIGAAVAAMTGWVCLSCGAGIVLDRRRDV
ncbi:hypothetical protein D9T14_00440 [Propionibacterium australiense]|uniref:ABC-2 family transporter protein n=1 Tax=Propionibacterium australiense TaxID=119981 RepID=A0A8B3FSF4_9ACTN|nr:hypothetical protein D7U36_07660 [Propionibacterium australiense]RLP12359.1 hypothetical protein D9T14_00440 [Propionibacterium australiense]